MTNVAQIGSYGIYNQAQEASNLVDVLAPVGTIMAYNPGYYTDGLNSGFQVVGPATNTVAGINAFLPENWRVCDGSALNNSQSPIWNNTNRYLPNLSNSRFLMGSTTTGAIGGSSSVTLSINNLPAHSHSIDHDHAAITSGAGSSHSHTINHDHSNVTSTGMSANNNHSHRVPTNQNGGAALVAQWASGNGSAGASSLDTIGSTTTAHTHDVDIPGLAGASGPENAHTHSVDLPSLRDRLEIPDRVHKFRLYLFI